MVQWFNKDAVLYYPMAKWFDRSLSVPHFSVEDISKINPQRLKELGFTGIVFDKDNTLTSPYALEIHPSIYDAFEEYKATFGDRIAIFSNSAGTKGEDKGCKEADKIEDNLGVKVLRHKNKKPSGIDCVIDNFNCMPDELVMFGDRLFTDVVFGNRYLMLTVHTQILSSEGDNYMAVKARNREPEYLNKMKSLNIRPPHHRKYCPDINRDFDSERK